MKLNRRHFLALIAALRTSVRNAWAATAFPVRFPKPSPFEALRKFIEPGSDEFQSEVDAMKLTTTEPGTRLYALNDGVVRFEKKSPGEYRVGYRKGGKMLSETVAKAAQPLFRDVTGELFGDAASFRDHLRKGVPYWRAKMDSASGIDIYGNNGIAVGDIDNDGVDEIYVCQNGGLPNRLYKRGPDGKMVDITERAGVGILDDTASALFVDFRNCGRQDLLVLRSAGPILFLNQGDGTFIAREDAFRFGAGAQGAFTGMAAADYDRDGKVDVYLCCYVYFQSEDQYRYPSPYQDARNGPPNFLFRNRLDAQGGGYFEDVTADTGLNQNNDRFSFAAAWCDSNNTGWPDLYVANDFGRKNFYRNVDGKFRDVAEEAGVDDPGPGMSAAWFDYDGDGAFDLYVSNMWSDTGQRVVASEQFKRKTPENAREWTGHTKGNSLFRNRGGKFQAIPEAEMGRWAWSADGHDFDNDGSPEILVTCGMLTNSSEKDLMSFFWRQVVAKPPGPAYEEGWNAINQFVREDYSWNGHEPNVFYVRRDGKYVDYSGVSGLDYIGDCRAFAVTDFDGDGNLDLIIKGRLGPQIRAFRNECGSARQSIAFRLTGVRSNRDAIGAVIRVDGQVKQITAGSGFLSQHTKALHFGLSDRKTAAQVTITWPSGEKQVFKNLTAGFRFDIKEGDTAAVHRAAFAARRPMSASPVAGVNAPVFEDTWLVEPVPIPERRKGPAFLALTAADFTAQPDLAAQYALFRRYLFEWRTPLEAPLMLLLDSEGRAVKIYAQRPDPAAIARDLVKHGEALPFAGRYFLRPHRNYYRLGAAFYLAGFPDQSVVYFEEMLRQNPANDKALNALGQIALEASNPAKARPYLERAVAANPRSFEAWNNLGGVAFQQNNGGEALAHYERALELRPQSANAMVNCGQAQLKLNHPIEAAELFERAAAADPSDPEPLTQLGLLAAQASRDAEARDYFKKAISIRRDYAGAINNLGVLYTKMGQRNDAIAAFEYGIKEAPDEEILYLNLGRLYANERNWEGAARAMRRLLERKPGNAVALKALHDLEAR